MIFFSLKHLFFASFKDYYCTILIGHSKRLVNKFGDSNWRPRTLNPILEASSDWPVNKSFSKLMYKEQEFFRKIEFKKKTFQNRQSRHNVDCEISRVQSTNSLPCVSFIFTLYWKSVSWVQVSLEWKIPIALFNRNEKSPVKRTHRSLYFICELLKRKAF